MKENEKDSILFHSPRIAEICLQGLSGQQRTGPVLDISHSEASQKDGKPFPSKAVSDRHILLQRLVKNIYNQSTITWLFFRKLEKKYACVVCGLKFHLLQNMQRHLQTHGARVSTNK